MSVVSERFIDLLIEDEAERTFPYDDATGKRLGKGDTIKGNITIGIGRNLSEQGINREEIRYLLSNDLAWVERDLVNNVKGFAVLDEVRQDVLRSVCFNMGIYRFLEFEKMLKAIEEKDWPGAAMHLLDSKAARQAPARYERLAHMMRTGQYWRKAA